jgi:hypothetical protein
LSRALEVLFILHAEHEMNCSTSFIRHITSSGVDVYTAIAMAAGALYGPKHGGANEAVIRMLEAIGSKENIQKYVQDVKDKKKVLFGFGHRVYKNYDPRAKIVKKIAFEVFEICGKEPLIEIAIELERIALEDEYLYLSIHAASLANSTPTSISTVVSSTAPWASPLTCSPSSSPSPEWSAGLPIGWSSSRTLRTTSTVRGKTTLVSPSVILWSWASGLSTSTRSTP